MPESGAVIDVRSATPTKQLVIERTINASPERVFDAFTDPDRLIKWWWPNGETQFSHYMGGEYYEIERPRRQVMSGRALNDEQGELFATLIEVTFEARDGGTALTIPQSYFEPMPPAQAMAGAEHGWPEQLDKLERLLTH